MPDSVDEYLTKNGIRVNPETYDYAERLNRTLEEKDPDTAKLVEFSCGFVKGSDKPQLLITLVELTLSKEQYDQAASRAKTICGVSN